jgi:hypothetical protein
MLAVLAELMFICILSYLCRFCCIKKPFWALLLYFAIIALFLETWTLPVYPWGGALEAQHMNQGRVWRSPLS